MASRARLRARPQRRQIGRRTAAPDRRSARGAGCCRRAAPGRRAAAPRPNRDRARAPWPPPRIRQRTDVGHAHVEALGVDRMHAMRGVADQRHPRRHVAAARAGPRAGRRPGRSRSRACPEHAAGEPQRSRPAASRRARLANRRRLRLALDPGDPGSAARQRQRRQGPAAPQPLAHRAAMRMLVPQRPWSGPAGRRSSGRRAIRASSRTREPRPSAPTTEAGRDGRAIGEVDPMARPRAAGRPTSPCAVGGRAGCGQERLAAGPGAAPACSTPTPNGPLPCASLS